MYLQLENLVTLPQVVEEISERIGLPEVNDEGGSKTELFNLQKWLIEGSCSEFVKRSCRIINRINDEVIFSKPEGLKNRLLKLTAFSLNKIAALYNSVVTVLGAVT